jgi:hypothetical protein
MYEGTKEPDQIQVRTESVIPLEIKKVPTKEMFASQSLGWPEIRIEEYQFVQVDHAISSDYKQRLIQDYETYNTSAANWMEMQILLNHHIEKYQNAVDAKIKQEAVDEILELGYALTRSHPTEANLFKYEGLLNRFANSIYPDSSRQKSYRQLLEDLKNKTNDR